VQAARAGARPIAVRPREAANLLGVSERTVRSLLATGALRSVKLGAARLIAVADLERLVMSEAAE
jgi:excisionase family DNA binding protein